MCSVLGIASYIRSYIARVQWIDSNTNSEQDEDTDLPITVKNKLCILR